MAVTPANACLLQRGGEAAEVGGLIGELDRNGNIHRLSHGGNKIKDLPRHGAHVHAGTQRRRDTHLNGVGAHAFHLAGKVCQLAWSVAPNACDNFAVASLQCLKFLLPLLQMNAGKQRRIEQLSRTAQIQAGTGILICLQRNGFGHHCRGASVNGTLDRSAVARPRTCRYDNGIFQLQSRIFCAK